MRWAHTRRGPCTGARSRGGGAPLGAASSLYIPNHGSLSLVQPVLSPLTTTQTIYIDATAGRQKFKPFYCEISDLPWFLRDESALLCTYFRWDYQIFSCARLIWRGSGQNFVGSGLDLWLKERMAQISLCKEIFQSQMFIPKNIYVLICIHGPYEKNIFNFTL